MRHFQFNTRKQKPGESLSEYVAVLCKAAEYCNFGTSFNEMLRDRLVYSIANSAVQNRLQSCLLVEKEVTRDKAISLSQAVEIAEKGAKDLLTVCSLTEDTAAPVSISMVISWPSMSRVVFRRLLLAVSTTKSCAFLLGGLLLHTLAMYPLLPQL